MQIRADVKCYYCGFVSGQVEGDPEGTSSRWNFRSTAGVTLHSAPKHRQLRCARCGGPVFLDDIETVRRTYRERDQAAAGLAR